MANSADNVSPIALLLHGGVLSPDDNRLGEVLNFLGIPWTAVASTELNEGNLAAITGGRSKFSILTSAPCLADVLLSANAKLPPEWLRVASSVFVFGFQTTEACRSLLRKISGDPEANIRNLVGKQITVEVAGDFPEMCGPMSGLRIILEAEAADLGFSIRPDTDGFKSLVAASEGHLFARVTYCGTPFYCDASQRVVDIHERSTTHFDVKKCFAGAVLPVMYLKWSFAEICWTTSETNASLIIDDPLLKPRYGFLDFRELLQLMNAENFTTTIAFIPWNWKRTDRNTVATFLQNGDILSVCVHGCDHSGGEFATRSIDLLDKKLRTARNRMHSLQERSALRHDPVMVFPQGAFSPEVGNAMKRQGFVAAVNTDVAPADKRNNETTIADLWNVANLRYGGFPIFTRRYITDGIENFAFDGLLGKPCFIVGHHELLRDHGSVLSEFLGRLKSLRWNLRWRTLGNSVNRCFSAQRQNGTFRVKMFAEHLILENSEAAQRQITVLKDETDIRAVKAFTVNQESVDYEYVGGCVQFVVSIPSRQKAEICCIYNGETTVPESPEPISDKLKVATRRYLSEFRDNYLARSPFLHRTAVVAKRLLSHTVDPRESEKTVITTSD